MEMSSFPVFHKPEIVWTSLPIYGIDEGYFTCLQIIVLK